MIVVDCQQGSAAWFDARLGIATASNFTKIITPKKLELSASADLYALALIWEQLEGEPIDGASSGYIARGKELESEAVSFLEFACGIQTMPVGFILTDDRRAGCSPDRLIGSDGLAEIKCPGALRHMEYLTGVTRLEEEYRVQVQGQLWVTGRRYVELLSYHPRRDPVLVHVERDDVFQAKLNQVMQTFFRRMDDLKVRLPASDQAKLVGQFAVADLFVA